MDFNTTVVLSQTVGANDTIDLMSNISRNELDFDELNQIIADYLKKDHTFDTFTETLLKLIYFVFIMSGILTNAVIICVIATNRKLLISNNLLLINLFVSDILLCIFCMPFTLIAIIRRSWAFGAFICKLVPFIQAVTTFVSAATISSIAIDRMNQITANQMQGLRHVVRTLHRPSPRLANYGYSTLVIWLVSLLLSAPIAIYQKVVEFGIKDLVVYPKCVESWPNNNRGIYSFVILITQLLIPSSVMLVSHYRIRGYLNKHRIRRNTVRNNNNNNNNNNNKDKDKHQSSDESFRSNNTNNTNNGNNSNDNRNVEEIQKEVVVVEDRPTNASITINCFLKPICENSFFDKELHRNNRITIFLLTVTIIFGISWLPWNLFNVYVDFYPDINLTPHDLYLVLAVCHLIAMSSATTNAIFYGFLHTAIRKELRNTIRRVKNYFR